MCRSSSNDEAIISLWVKITAIWQSNFPSTMTIETFPPTKISVTRWHTFWLKFGRGLFSQKHQYYIKISPLCTKTDLNITDIQSFGVWILAPHFMLSGHSDKDVPNSIYSRVVSILQKSWYLKCQVMGPNTLLKSMFMQIFKPLALKQRSRGIAQFY